MTTIVVTATMLLAAFAAAGQTPVNAGAAIVYDFEQRTGNYVKNRKQWTKSISKLKPNSSPVAIKQAESDLVAAIRQGRSGAQQGEICTPAIAGELRRLVGITMSGPNGAAIRQALKNAEPVKIQLHVNDPYPPSVPLQSTPPTLILNLPKLPPELDYRVIGRSLVLRDVDASLIVDFVPDLIR